jgi:DnaJ-class molecular chaperone
MRFPGEGNQSEETTVGDLVVELTQAEGEIWNRQGDDLVYYHKISLVNVLTSAPIEFSTIDGEVIRFSSDEVITPQTQKVFVGKGMPIYNDNPLSPLLASNQRGNLVLRFTIEVPKSFRDEQRQRLVEILAQ